MRAAFDAVNRSNFRSVIARRVRRRWRKARGVLCVLDRTVPQSAPRAAFFAQAGEGAMSAVRATYFGLRS